jgi:hypothetical protein
VRLLSPLSLSTLREVSVRARAAKDAEAIVEAVAYASRWEVLLCYVRNGAPTLQAVCARRGTVLAALHGHGTPPSHSLDGTTRSGSC